MINRYSSARRHRWAQQNTANLAELHNKDLVSRSRLQPVEDRRIERASNEKECRALMASRLRHNSNSTSRRSRGSKVARLRELTAARGSGNHRVDSNDNQKKRHRQGSNNFLACKL
jgi:hypothetical protein